MLFIGKPKGRSRMISNGRIRGVTHSHVPSRDPRHLTHSNMTWLIHIWHDSFARATPHVNESCHMLMSHITYEWVMSHMWMSQVTHVNESDHTCWWVMLQVDESYHAWLSHVAYSSCHVTYVYILRATSHIFPSCKAAISVTWLIHTWHDSFPRAKLQFLGAHTDSDSFLSDTTHSHVPSCNYLTRTPSWTHS